MQGAFQRVRVRLNAKETTHPFKMVQTADELENASLIPGRPCADAVQRRTRISHNVLSMHRSHKISGEPKGGHGC